MISNIIVNRHCTNALCLNISFYERKKSNLCDGFPKITLTRTNIETLKN